MRTCFAGSVPTGKTVIHRSFKWVLLLCLFVLSASCQQNFAAEYELKSVVTIPNEKPIAGSAYISYEKKLFVLSSDGIYTSWDASTGKLNSRDLKTKKCKTALSLSRNAVTYLMQEQDETYVVKSVTNDSKTVLDGCLHREALRAALSNKGDTLVTFDGFGSFTLWDATTGMRIQTKTDDRSLVFFSNVEMMEDGKLIGVASLGQLSLWDSTTAKKKWQLFEDSNEKYFSRAAFSSAGNFVVIAGVGTPRVLVVEDRGRATAVLTPIFAKVININTNQEKEVLFADSIDAIALSPKGDIFAVSCNERKSISVYDSATGTISAKLNFKEDITSLSFSGSRWIIATDSKNTVTLYEFSQK